MNGALVLENGDIFTGVILGKTNKGYGEVVFHTGMTGYQEVLTDPSYYGQMVVMTYPLIGNYGIHADQHESKKVWLNGFITSEMWVQPAHPEQSGGLIEFLDEHEVVALTEVDTRRLVRTIRSGGTMRGWIVDEETLATIQKDGLDSLVFPQIATNQVEQVTTPEVYQASTQGHSHVVVIDFGAKDNIVQSLVQLGCKVTVVPARTPLFAIERMYPDGVVLSNGPGDPTSCSDVLPTIRALTEQVPVFGICLGHQLLALAYGAQTQKMHFGHRGANHPVKDLKTGRVWMTSQNHSYEVAASSVPSHMEVTHVQVNDGSVEGIRIRGKSAFSVQFHPEARPGPRDSEILFETFLTVMAERREHSLVYTG